MPKGLVFVGQNAEPYGFISNAKIYNTPAMRVATGLEMATLPDTTSGVIVPHRLEDLLQAGELRSVVVVVNDGAGKRSNRSLFVTKAKVLTFRKKSTEGGLIGLPIDGKTVLSASIPRRASYSLP